MSFPYTAADIAPVNPEDGNNGENKCSQRHHDQRYYDRGNVERECRNIIYFPSEVMIIVNTASVPIRNPAAAHLRKPANTSQKIITFE